MNAHKFSVGDKAHLGGSWYTAGLEEYGAMTIVAVSHGVIYAADDSLTEQYGAPSIFSECADHVNARPFDETTHVDLYDPDWKIFPV